MKLSTMTRGGVTVDVPTQAKILREWFDQDITPFTKAWMLDARVFENTGEKTVRIGDALIQKMRKAGVIEYDGKVWHLTDEFADNIHDHIAKWETAS